MRLSTHDPSARLAPARRRVLPRALGWAVVAVATAFRPAPVRPAQALSVLPPRDAYQPIVVRDPFVPYYRPAQAEESAPAPAAPPPVADREFFIQAIVTGLDGQLRASVQEKNAPPTRLLRQGESQAARPEEGQPESIEIVSIDPKAGLVVIASGNKNYNLTLKENVAELPKTQVARAKQTQQQQQLAQAGAAVNNPNLRRQPGAPGTEAQDPAERARQMAAELAARRSERLERLKQMRDAGQLENLSQMPPAPPPPMPPGMPSGPDPDGGGPPAPG